MKPRDYPSIQVATKYGDLTMTFLSPRLEMKECYRDDRRVKEAAGALARISTDDGKPLIINRIPLRIYFGLVYGTSFYENGQKREIAVTEMRQDQNAYNRRADGSGWDYSAGYAAKVRELQNTVLREAYEAHPELVAEAERVYLHNVAAAAFAKVEEANNALADARAAFATASRAAGATS
jgi:hypothetical protein